MVGRRVRVALVIAAAVGVVACTPPTTGGGGSTTTTSSTTSTSTSSTTSSTTTTTTPPDTSNNPVAITVGSNHRCALMPDHTVRCWGSNSYGQLGDGTTTASDAPVAVSGLTDVVQVEAGAATTCARTSEGEVDCWGSGFYGQLGNGGTADSSTPVTVAGLTDVTDISNYNLVVCAVSGGQVFCWGNNPRGQLGNGTTASSNVPVAVTGITDAVQVAVGEYHACALMADGTASCWGDDYELQLGGSPSGGAQTTSTPIAVPWLTSAVDIEAGRYNTCARLLDGGVTCWGSNSFGQLGGWQNYARSATGVTIPAVSGSTVLAVGDQLACAATAPGRPSCWGNTSGGAFGPRSLARTYDPLPLEGVGDVVDVSVRSDVCVARSDGEVDCSGPSFGGVDARGPVRIAGFGPDVDRPPVLVLPSPVARDDGSGGAVVAYSASAIDDLDGTAVAVTCDLPSGSAFPLGESTVACSATDSGGNTTEGSFPVTVIEPGRATISAGKSHTCMVTSSSTVRCWGRNESGQLGNGTTTNSSVPVEVSGLDDVSSVSAGSTHTCALKADGTVWCWGANNGRLGNGATAASAVPVQVVGLIDATGLSVGEVNTCAVRAGGTVSCWGGSSVTAPTTVAALTDAVQVAAGTSDTCALRAMSTVVCWGVTNPATATSPTVGGGLSGVIEITGSGTAQVGTGSHCALATTGAVWCWGNGTDGQLGTGGTGIDIGGNHQPALVRGMYEATGLSSGYRSACASTSSHHMSCWGSGTSGQFGDGYKLVRGYYSNAVGITTASEVAIGTGHACARVGPDAVTCSGSNSYGQLGNGTTTDSNVPVDVTGL